ncbi:aftiphilin isoform X2 [Conger conger]|uniref:aftiphilin isoform X2 n=1 Tax=Conger conger TaxID=82655 RepID=UPI002A5AD422|nr:aftiphilin isoform X2 [Conger conger]
MEPDVIRMYSSSPPPLDDAAEEEDEEFGDFGGFSGVASSVSFGEFESPKGCGQPHATDTSPPVHFNAVASSFPPDLVPGGPGRGSGVAQPRSDHDPRAPGCSRASPRSERTCGGEAVRKPAPRTQTADGARTESRARDRSGDVAAPEVLTNGFAPFDAEEAPVVRPKKRGPAAKPALDCCGHRPATDPAQRDTPRQCSQVSDSRDTNGLPEGKYLAGPIDKLHSGTGPADRSVEGNGVEDDACSTGSLTVAREGLKNGAWGSYTGEDSEHSDPELWTAPLSDRRDRSPTVRSEEAGERQGSPCCRTEGAGEDGGMKDECAVAPGTVSASVSDDFASFCQAVSPDGLEDFGDFSVTGFAAPPFPEGERPPGDSADDEEGGSFGDFGRTGPAMPDTAADFTTVESAQEELFGEFGGPEDGAGGNAGGDPGGFPGSDSFADFTSAPTGAEPDAAAGWNAFGQPEGAAPDQGDSWAAFREERGAVPADESEKTCWDAAVTAPPSGSPQTCRRDSLSVTLASRLERLFRASFPETRGPDSGEQVPSLKAVLEPPDGQPEPGEERGSARYRDPRDVWWQLQDIHDAFGLKFQWGGSHSNQALLCSLGIDTRNIMFAGQKKQPVTVPVYAAGLGMLEPTKKPVNPLSVAEKMASIAQAPSSSPETSSSPQSTQEALLPIQFDWSSSGLNNPLDAKLGTSRTSSLPDAVARLMSAVEKTSSSSRNPGREGPLSEEAGRVMRALPDLSFMQARVLMFPVALA